MFKSLFRYHRVSLRHANGPLAEERRTFLAHLQSQGLARSTLAHYAGQLLIVANRLIRKGRTQVTRTEVARGAQRWARRQRRRGRAQSLKWSAERFAQVASTWFSFMGWLKDEPRPRVFYAPKLADWADFLDRERMSQRTSYSYCWWIRAFLQWLKPGEVRLRQISLGTVNEFMEHLASRGLSRVTLATAAKVLRRFLRYAYEQGWCQRDVAAAILSPRLFRQEELPSGPAWTDVQRLIAATDGNSKSHLRNRAILLLLAVYGLRSGEVRSLHLEDLDWTRRVLRVRRSKTARVQKYPLTAAMAQALRRYLKEARPKCARNELFLTLKAPFGRLSAGAVYHLTCFLLDRLNIPSPKRGPHALRHASATYLLNSGYSLKAVGDHLGHRDLSTTQVYAKVDLVGLRTVAAFDLGGLL